MCNAGQWREKKRSVRAAIQYPPPQIPLQKRIFLRILFAIVMVAKKSSETPDFCPADLGDSNYGS